jgi:hypothetical protein
MVRKKKKPGNTLFEGIRKPTAPPTRQIGDKKPEEKIHPAGRATKHKGRISDTNDVDI